MRFNKLYEKKLNPEQSAVSSGVQTLGTDQWMGTYKWSKDVAGHDGEKQHAPENPSGNDVYTDKPVVVGFSDADDKMTKAAMNGKVTQSVKAGSKEPKDVNASSPLSKNEDASPMIKPPSNRFDSKQEAFAYAREHGGKVFKRTYTNPLTGDTQVSFVVKQEQGVAEGSEEGSYSDKFVQSQIDYYTKHGLSGTAADRERINGSLNYYQHIKNKRIKDGTWQEQGVAEGLPQTLRKVVPGYAKREIDRKMDAGKFGKTDADKDANFQRYKKIQDKIKEQGVAEGSDLESKKIGRIIKKYYQQIADQGDDSLDYLHDRAEQFARIWDIYEGDLDSIIADEPVELLKMIANELKEIASELLDEAYNNYHANRTGFARGPRDSERHDLDAPTAQEWGLKIDGKVWSRDGKAVTFASKQQALTARQTLLAKRPGLEIGLVTRAAEDVEEDKIKGADGKACWDGYRYNGTEDGQDSCVKVKEDAVDEDVIYRLDRENPMNDTEVLVIGGAGRYSLDGLRNKARKEVEQLAKDLAIDHGGAFRRSAHNVRQLQNTLNTIVAAYDELNQLRKLGGQRSKGIKDEDAAVVREGVELMEKWTQKYKNSINCSNPKGFSQKAHCAGKKK